MVTFCPKCGTQALDDQSLFCNKCGTQLPMEISEEPGNYCPNCKTKIPDGETISCIRCGFLFSTHPPSSQPVKPAKNCPQCRAPVIDESRYYCKTCGAYIRDAQAGKVSVADDSSSGHRHRLKNRLLYREFIRNSGTGTIIKPENPGGKEEID